MPPRRHLAWQQRNGTNRVAHRAPTRVSFSTAPMKLKDDARFSTICIHAGQEPDPATGAIITPIYQTSTYVQDGLGQPHAGFEYGRTQNPTRMALERNVAAIEAGTAARSEEHTSELQSQSNLVCRLLLEKKNKKK